MPCWLAQAQATNLAGCFPAHHGCSCPRASSLPAPPLYLDHKHVRQGRHTGDLGGVAVHLHSTMNEGTGILAGRLTCQAIAVRDPETHLRSGGGQCRHAETVRSSASNTPLNALSHLGEAGQAVGAVNVHGARAADALAARPPQAQGLVLQGGGTSSRQQ